MTYYDAYLQALGLVIWQTCNDMIHYEMYLKHVVDLLFLRRAFQCLFIGFVSHFVFHLIKTSNRIKNL